MRNSIRRSLPFLFALFAFAAAFLHGSAPARAQAALTGVTIVGANLGGAPLPFYDWYTQSAPPNFAWKVWLIRGTDRNGPFFNGPTSATSDINIPLTPGTYTYTVFVAHNTTFAGTRDDPPAFGINLFFNGAVAPNLSAHAPTQTSLSSLPIYMATSDAVGTRGYDGRVFPASGTLCHRVGGMEISLVDWRMTAMPVYGMSRVGPMEAVPSGLPSNVGQFTLRVEPINGPPSPKLEVSWVGAAKLVTPDIFGRQFLSHTIVVRNVGCGTAYDVQIDMATYGPWSAIFFQSLDAGYALWPLWSHPYKLGDIPEGWARQWGTYAPPPREPTLLDTISGIAFAFPDPPRPPLPPSGAKYPLYIRGDWSGTLVTDEHPFRTPGGTFEARLRSVLAP